MNQLATLESVEAIVIKLDGAFDITQSDRLGVALSAAVTARHVFLDLTHTTFIDRHAIRTIVRFDRKLKRLGAQLILVGATGAVRRLLEIANLYALLDQPGTTKAKPSEGRESLSSCPENAPVTF